MINRMVMLDCNEVELQFRIKNKAAYLARQCKPKESLSSYETLLMRQFLMEEDKNRIRTNIATLKEQLRSEGTS